MSEDRWLLYAADYGSKSAEFGLTVVDTFAPGCARPRGPIRVPVQEWKTDWNRRLRPYLLPTATRALYRKIARHPETAQFGDFPSINIGYVTGANEFFHLRPSTAAHYEVPREMLHPSVRNSRSLHARTLTHATVEEWRNADDPALLLRLSKTSDLPAGIRRYLETDVGRVARTAFKCRTRTPWYSVPDVKVPDFFLTVMAGVAPQLVRNVAGCVCTNALHTVRVREAGKADRMVSAWDTPFVLLSCELEGYPGNGAGKSPAPRARQAFGCG